MTMSAKSVTQAPQTARRFTEIIAYFQGAVGPLAGQTHHEIYVIKLNSDATDNAAYLTQRRKDAKQTGGLA